MNGQRAKPHREVKIGDEIHITRPLGRRQRIVVRGLAERHVPKADARSLYDDVTPPPTPEELELRRLVALSRTFRPTRRAPTKRERRQLRRAKGQDD